ncbi:MAG: polysaccharide lyase [Acidobacteriaceae bacterium]|jgi:hypothetical protein
MRIGSLSTFSLFLLSLCVHAQTAPTPAPSDIYDGFEAPTLSDIWETTTSVPGAINIQSQIVRAGHSAVRVDLHSHDKFAQGHDGDLDTERDEIKEADRLSAHQDASYEYSWSMYLAPDFPIVPVRLVVAQWHQNCNRRARPLATQPAPEALELGLQPDPSRSPCDNDSPSLAIRYMDGVLRVTRALGDNKFTLWEEKRDLRGRWLDIRVQARFSPESTGRVKVWFDGRQVVDYAGPLANPETPASGYSSPGIFNFKFGLYRDVMPQPMTAYFDEYRKKQLPSESMDSPSKP